MVGINEYQNWPRLEYAADDAREMAARLEVQGFQTYLLTDEQATLQNILARLETIRRSVDENSRLMFYFAGHGQTEDLPEGRERGYIVPADADAYNWHDTMLPMDRLNRMISRFKAKHILLAFDSCYSGLGLSRSINPLFDQDSAYIRKMMRSRSIQILTAGSRSEQVLEAGGHGLFTDNLLAALAGAADINSDGYITATEIYATLRPAITQQSYSRQTPQFGYIEGNGDFIFLNSSPEPAQATVVVETAISGIDVWAGTSEIGHRMPAGRHRLTANAGQTSLMVKKGGRTLYRNNILLSANRVFPIQIGAAERISPQHEAFSTITISDQKVDNYSNSIAYDLDGDGREEMVTASGNCLYAFRFDGTIFWQKKFNSPIALDLIDDWNSQPAIGLSAVDDDSVRLLLLNQQGEPIWQHVRKLTRNYRGQPGGSGKIAGLADIDRDGDTEIVAIAEAEYTLKPRGIIVYDSRAREVWRYTMGPSPQNIMIWQKDSGRPDIIIGTFGSGSGNRESHNNTSDMQSYILSINDLGKTNWLIPVGDYYTGVVVLPAESKSSSREFFYAHTYASSSYREDQGAIYKISRSGKILNRFQTENSILSAATSGSDTSGGQYVYAADSRGSLLQLDNRLNLIRTRPMNEASTTGQIRLVGVHDYDGDGYKDLLLYSFNRLLPDKNPLAASNPHDNGFMSDLKFQIVSHDFSRVIKSVTIAGDWENGRGFAVKDLDRPETSQYPFMALSDKMTLFNY